MTKRATQRAPQPIPEPTPLELAPTDYQPSKAELEEEFDMPGMTMDEVLPCSQVVCHPAGRTGPAGSFQGISR